MNRNPSNERHRKSSSKDPARWRADAGQRTAGVDSMLRAIRLPQPPTPQDLALLSTYVDKMRRSS